MRFALFFFFAAIAASQNLTALSATLQSVRIQEALAPAQYREIRRQFIAWIDSRAKAGDTEVEMNRQLEDAHLIPPEQDADDDSLDRQLTGYVAGVSMRTLASLRVFVPAIFQNNWCGLGHTALLYNPAGERIGVIQPGGFDQAPFHLADIAVQKQGNAWLVASGWVISNCTSTWNGTAIRIDRIAGGISRTLMEVSPGARQLGERVIRVEITGDVAEFRYTAGLADGELMEYPMAARYRIGSASVTRLAPPALSFAGFINEWLQRMNGAEAKRWGSPQAVARRAAINAAFKKNTITWTSIATCNGITEIGAYFGDHTPLYVFGISGERAADLKMVRIAPSHSCPSQPLSRKDGFEPIAKELP